MKFTVELVDGVLLLLVVEGDAVLSEKVIKGVTYVIVKLLSGKYSSTSRK